MAVRLSRVEQQARTRSRLLAAGEIVFKRRGYLATTVEEIVEVAGYTRGALYKHFDGKEGLWQAIVTRRADQDFEQINAALAGTDSPSALVEALAGAAAASRDDVSQWGAAGAGFLAQLAERPDPASPASDYHRQYDARLAALLDERFQALGIRPRLATIDLVRSLHALGTGLALRRAVDDTIESHRVLTEVVSNLLTEQPRTGS